MSHPHRHHRRHHGHSALIGGVTIPATIGHTLQKQYRLSKQRWNRLEREATSRERQWDEDSWATFLSTLDRHLAKLRSPTSRLIFVVPPSVAVTADQKQWIPNILNRLQVESKQFTLDDRGVVVFRPTTAWQLKLATQTFARLGLKQALQAPPGQVPPPAPELVQELAQLRQLQAKTASDLRAEEKKSLDAVTDLATEQLQVRQLHNTLAAAQRALEKTVADGNREMQAATAKLEETARQLEEAKQAAAQRKTSYTQLLQQLHDNISRLEQDKKLLTQRLQTLEAARQQLSQDWTRATQELKRVNEAREADSVVIKGLQDQVRNVGQTDSKLIQELNTLRQRLVQVEDERDRLQTWLRTSAAELNASQIRVDDLTTELKRREQEWKEKDEQYRGQIMRLEDETKALVQRLNQALSSQQSTEKKLGDAVRDLAAERVRLDEADRKHAQDIAQLSKASEATRQALEQKVAQGNQEMQRLRAELDATLARMAEAKQQALQEAKAHQTLLQRLEANFAQLQETKVQLTLELQQLETARQQLASEVKRLSQLNIADAATIQQLRAQVANMGQTDAKYLQQIQSLNQRLPQVEAERKNLQTQLVSSAARADTAEASVELLGGRFAQQEQEFKQKDADNRRQIDQLKAESAAFARQLDEAKATRAALGTQYENCKQQLLTQTTECQRKLEDLNAQLLTTTGRDVQLEQKLARLGNDIKTANDLLADMTRQRDSFKTTEASYQKCQAQVAASQQTIVRLQTDQANLNRQVQQNEGELARLQADLTDAKRRLANCTSNSADSDRTNSERARIIQSELNVLQQKQKEAIESNERLHAQLGEARSNTARAAAERDMAWKQLDNLQLRIQGLEAQLAVQALAPGPVATAAPPGGPLLGPAQPFLAPAIKVEAPAKRPSSKRPPSSKSSKPKPSVRAEPPEKSAKEAYAQGITQERGKDGKSMWEVHYSTTHRVASWKLLKGATPALGPVAEAKSGRHLLVAEPKLDLQSNTIITHVIDPSRETCEKEYKKVGTEPLGEGTYGQVWRVCDKKDCKHEWALKITQVVPWGCDKSKNYTTTAVDKLETAKRDPYFLKVLANEKLDGHDLVPRLVDTWLCVNRKVMNESYDQWLSKQSARCRAKHVLDLKTLDTPILFVVMDRWDGDIEALAKKRGAGRVGKNASVYRVSELRRMFRIAVRLGQRGIYHGDLKPDQYLQRNNGKELAVADFGFSGGPGYFYKGVEGWSSNKVTKFDCPEGFEELKWSEQTKFRPIRQNLLQLESSLVLYGSIYVERDDLVGPNPLVRFAGISDFVKQTSGPLKGMVGRKSDTKDDPCPGYNARFAKFFKSVGPIFQFSLADITPLDTD